MEGSAQELSYGRSASATDHVQRAVGRASPALLPVPTPVPATLLAGPSAPQAHEGFSDTSTVSTLAAASVLDVDVAAPL